MAESIRINTVEARRAQAFPTLAPAEVERMRRFGTVRRYAEGERLFETGKPGPGMCVVLAGAIRITSRDAHGNDILIVEHTRGMFAGEVGINGDLGVEIDRTRVRVNVFDHLGGHGVAARLIRDNVPTLSSLDLPPELASVVDLRDGRVRVCGPWGSGTATTRGTNVSFR